MKYYKANIQESGLITWDLWANSLAELTELGEDENPLIYSENDIPELIYGIYPLKLVEGELVELNSTELEAAENEYNIKIAVAAHQNKINLFNTETFEYDGSNFLMDQSSHLYYLAMDKLRQDYLVLNANGELYELYEGSIQDFLEHYYAKIILLISPNNKV